jgi:hypothetical protein
MRQPTSIVLEATITRADGTIEPQGVVAYWHKNPFMRMLARLRGIKGTARPSCG